MSEGRRQIFNLSEAPDTDICEATVPPLGDNFVSVCFSSSNEYTPILGTAVESLVENTSGSEKYDIVILNRDISENNKAMLRQIVAKKDNCHLRFMNIGNLVEGRSFYTWAHFTAFTYYRLLIPMLYARYKKVVYLDSDIIVNHDIAELFHMDIGGFLLAAARDTHVAGRMNLDCPWRDSYYQDELKAGPKDYFQAGVMLVNIEEFAKRYKGDALFQKAGETKYRWLDQDFLNVECRGRVKHLPNYWNTMIINTPSKIDEEYLNCDLMEEYLAARKAPYIIHYVGRSIPCYKPAADMYRYFWKYARNTPYYELLLSIMVAESEKRSHIRLVNESRRLREMIAPHKKMTIKRCIKDKLIMPIVNVLLPRGSARRAAVKRFYFKLRGFEIN